MRREARFNDASVEVAVRQDGAAAVASAGPALFGLTLDVLEWAVLPLRTLGLELSEP